MGPRIVSGVAAHRNLVLRLLESRVSQATFKASTPAQANPLFRAADMVGDDGGLQGGGRVGEEENGRRGDR